MSAHWRTKFQDATAAPVVSPVSAINLTVTPPVGFAVCMFRNTTKNIKYGEGTFAGTAGNGYGTALVNEWVAMSVSSNVGAQTLATTSDGIAGTWEFFFKTEER